MATWDETKRRASIKKHEIKNYIAQISR